MLGWITSWFFNSDVVFIAKSEKVYFAKGVDCLCYSTASARWGQRQNSPHPASRRLDQLLHGLDQLSAVSTLAYSYGFHPLTNDKLKWREHFPEGPIIWSPSISFETINFYFRWCSIRVTGCSLYLLRVFSMLVVRDAADSDETMLPYSPRPGVKKFYI